MRYKGLSRIASGRPIPCSSLIRMRSLVQIQVGPRNRLATSVETYPVSTSCPEGLPPRTPRPATAHHYGSKRISPTRRRFKSRWAHADLPGAGPSAVRTANCHTRRKPNNHLVETIFRPLTKRGDAHSPPRMRRGASLPTSPRTLRLPKPPPLRSGLNGRMLAPPPRRGGGEKPTVRGPENSPHVPILFVGRVRVRSIRNRTRSKS